MRNLRRCAGFLGIIVWIGSWYITYVVLLYLDSPKARFVASPFAVAKVLGSLCVDPLTWEGIGATLTITLSGVAMATLLGIPTGLLLGVSSFARGAFGPMVGMLRSLPSAAVIPVCMLFLDLGLRKALAVVTFGAVWPIVVSTWDGIAALPKPFVDTVETLRLPRPLALRLALRSSLPHMLSGIRISASIALILTITVEMYAPGSQESGIGRLIIRGQDNLRYEEMYAAIVLLMLVAYALNIVVQRAADFVSGGTLVGESRAVHPTTGIVSHLHIPTELQSLPEWQLRLLTTDKLTEALEEIFGSDMVCFHLDKEEVREAGKRNREIRFVHALSREPLVLGFVNLDVEQVESWIARSTGLPSGFLADLEAGQSLGRVLRRHLRDEAVYVDGGLTASELDGDPTTEIPTNVQSRFPREAGVLVRRNRQIFLPGGSAPIADIQEYFAIGVLDRNPPSAPAGESTDGRGNSCASASTI